MVDVGGNDRAAARDFAAHELRRDEVRNRCAEALTRVLARHQLRQRLQHCLALEVFADGDELHLRRDDAAARVMHLRDIGGITRTTRLALQIEAHPGQGRVREPLAAVRGGELRELDRVAAFLDPVRTHRRQALADVDRRRGIGIGARGIVDNDGRIVFHPE